MRCCGHTWRSVHTWELVRGGGRRRCPCLSVCGTSVPCVVVCECLCVQRCTCGCTPGCAIPLCPHPAGSASWGGCSGPSSVPHPRHAGPPREIPQLTPWAQQGQDPGGFRCRRHLQVTATPLPRPSLPGTVMLPVLQGEQPGTPSTAGAPDPSAVSPRARGQLRLFLPGYKVLLLGSPHTTTLLTSRTLSSAGRKSRRYRAAGCSPCCGLWPEISWHGHHNSIYPGLCLPHQGGAQPSFPLTSWG